MWSTTPLSIWERLSAVLMLPIALGLTALLIAYTMMMQQHSTDFARDLAGQRSALRAVAKHYRLPVDLCVRIWRFIEAAKTPSESR